MYRFWYTCTGLHVLVFVHMYRPTCIGFCTHVQAYMYRFWYTCTGLHVYIHVHWRRNRGSKGACAPPPHFSEWGKAMFVLTHFQTQNLGLGIEPTDICDVTLAWLASRCWARQMCPPPPFCHVPTPLMYIHTHTYYIHITYIHTYTHTSMCIGLYVSMCCTGPRNSNIIIVYTSRDS